MELFLTLIAVSAIFYLTYRGILNTKDLADSKLPESETPPAPVLTQACGCGRSKTGYCVGLHKLSDEEWAVHEDNPNKKKTRKPRAKKSAE